jgi:hypothetical protein
VIDFRYHLVSLISVFLALALGIVVGTTQLNGAVLTDLHHQVDGLKTDKHTLQESTRQLQSQIKADDDFATGVGPSVVAGRLKGAGVLVVVAPQAGSALVDGVTHALKSGGATISGQVQLTSDYVDPRLATGLRDFVTSPGVLPAGFRLPRSNDSGVLAGSRLADVLMQPTSGDAPSNSERQQVLAGFSQLGVLRLVSKQITPSDYAVVVASDAQTGANPSAQAGTLSDLAGALDSQGKGAVVAGTGPVAGDNGVIGNIRQDKAISAKVSTVDDADRASGQVITVLALADQSKGKTGQYGVAGNAESTFPSNGQ